MEFTVFKKEILELAAQCKGRVSLRIESDNGVIELNSHERYSSASLIKMPILIEGFRQSEQGKLDLNQTISVLPAERAGGSGVLQALSDDLTMKVIDLMALMIIVSDNTATNLLIDCLGQKNINQCIKALGMVDTALNRKMMDFESLKKGIDNITTANDMVACLKGVHHNGLLTANSSNQAIKIMKNQQFRNKLLTFMDHDKVEAANKTGELPGVEHDCAIISSGGNTIYTAILIDQLSCQESGRLTIAQLGKCISRYIVNE